MGSGKAEKPSKNPKKKRKPLGPNRVEAKPKSKRKREKNRADLIESKSDNEKSRDQEVQAAPAAEQQLSFFLDQFQSANGVQLSSLELDSIKDTCIVELSQDMDQEVENLGNHMKAAFGPSWKESLCEKHLLEGKVDPGSPALLIISSSALRSIQLLKGFRSLTKECHAAKLFSKHMKVEEQVSLLKNRVNIASGTPSRIKKLIDIDALGLSRLAVILLDIHPDVKGYSLFTLPQLRDEFWDLYKNYFHQRLLQGDMRICLYGPLTSGTKSSGKKRGVTED
ncbi:protein CMS1 [Alnus glutinosa]|uniref:protein CMS1 n=1 Tax=Alnus glutinosa TaxID=3517 RepID=UPI002D78C038|nr:protein CMS1 [Alnus glutinosa]